MAITISSERRAIVVEYDTDLVNGDSIEVVAVNTETGDTGNRNEGNNDGEAVLFCPPSFEGDWLVTVTGSEGGSDTGTVHVSPVVSADVPEENGDEE